MMTREQFDRFVQGELEDLRARYEGGRSLEFPEAKLLSRRPERGGAATGNASNPFVQFVAMPDLDDALSRVHLQNMARQLDTFAIMVKLELWYAELPSDASPEAIAALRKAEAARSLHELEPPLRKEKVRVFFEAERWPIEAWDGELARATKDARPSLGPWKRLDLVLPWPRFKRYLPARAAL